VASVIFGFIGSALLGFTLGLFSFRIKSRWCPDCGAWTYRRRPTRTQASQ